MNLTPPILTLKAVQLLVIGGKYIAQRSPVISLFFAAPCLLLSLLTIMLPAQSTPDQGRSNMFLPAATPKYDRKDSKGPGAFPCPQCPVALSRMADLKVHMNKHTDRFKCQTCHFRFNRDIALQAHILAKHTGLQKKPTRPPAPATRAPAPQSTTVPAHTPAQSPAPAKIQIPAPAATKQLSLFERIQQVQNEERRITGEDDNSRDLLQNAMSLANISAPAPAPFPAPTPSPAPARGPIISPSSTAREQNVSHKNIKDRADCADCGFKSTSQKSIDTHKGGHIGTFKCKRCGKGFSRIDNLQNHQARVCAGGVWYEKYNTNTQRPSNPRPAPALAKNTNYFPTSSTEPPPPASPLPPATPAPAAPAPPSRPPGPPGLQNNPRNAGLGQNKILVF